MMILLKIIVVYVYLLTWEFKCINRVKNFSKRFFSLETEIDEYKELIIIFLRFLLDLT